MQREQASNEHSDLNHQNIPISSGFGKRGLVNEGNTCYANSLLQVLQHLAEFKRIIYKINCDSEFQFPAPLQELFYELGLNKSSSVRITSLIRSLNWTDYDASIQHDVTEFFMMLIEVLDNKLQSQGNQRTAISDLFQGVIRSEIRCLYVDDSSQCNEIFIGLPLQVKDQRDMIKSLEKYTEKEILKNENQFSSDKYGRQDAERVSVFQKVPPILVFYLKRFLNEGGEMKKIMDRYEFYEELNHFEEKYYLYAVLVHVGKHLNGGHYYTYIRDLRENQWYQFNDTTVKLVTTKQAVIDNFGVPEVSTYLERFQQNYQCAYMLVYVSETYKLNENPTQFQEIPKWLQDKINHQLEREREEKVLQQNLVIHQIQYENIQPGLFGMLFQKVSQNFQLNQQRIKKQFAEFKAEKILYEKNKKFSHYIKPQNAHQIFMYKATKNVHSILTSESLTPISKYLDLQTLLVKQTLEQDLACMALIKIDVEKPQPGQILCLIKYNTNNQNLNLQPLWVQLDDSIQEILQIIQATYQIICSQAFIMQTFNYHELSLYESRTLRQVKKQLSLQDVFTLILSQNRINLYQSNDVEIIIKIDGREDLLIINPDLNYDQLTQLLAPALSCHQDQILIKFWDGMEYKEIDTQVLDNIRQQDLSLISYITKDLNEILVSKHPISFLKRTSVLILDADLLIFDSLHRLQLPYRKDDRFSNLDDQLKGQISQILSTFAVDFSSTQLFVMLFEKEHNYLSQVLEFSKFMVRQIEQQIEKFNIKFMVRSAADKKENKIFCNFRIGIHRYDQSIEPVWFFTDRSIKLKQLLLLVQQSKNLDQRTMNRLKVFVNGEPSISYRNNMKLISDPESIIFNQIESSFQQSYAYVDIDLQQNELKLNV